MKKPPSHMLPLSRENRLRTAVKTNVTVFSQLSGLLHNPGPREKLLHRSVQQFFTHTSLKAPSRSLGRRK